MERKGEWDELHEEAMEELATWRQANPKATLAEIERQVDERMATLRAQLATHQAHEGAVALEDLHARRRFGRSELFMRGTVHLRRAHALGEAPYGAGRQTQLMEVAQRFGR